MLGVQAGALFAAAAAAEEKAVRSLQALLAGRALGPAAQSLADGLGGLLAGTAAGAAAALQATSHAATQCSPDHSEEVRRPESAVRDVAVWRCQLLA